MEINIAKVDAFVPFVMKFVNNKGLVAMKDGLMVTMPLSLIGSIFLLIACAPIPGWNDWMITLFGKQWQDPLWQVVGATFDILALASVLAIAYRYAKNENCEPLSAGILAVVSYLIIMASSVTTKSGEVVGAVIPRAWTGGKGMITAILVGLAVGYIYSWFINRNIRIKLPDGVPEGVATAFSALIPGTVIVTLSFLFFIFCKVTTGQTFIEVVYKVLQIPLQGLTSSLLGALAIPFLISFFWWFGIHGAAIVGGVMGPILAANGLANQDAFNSGVKLVAGQNAHIVTQQFVDQFITFGGSGMTLGLVIAMLILAKSQQMKTLAKLALVPGIFNINEPVVFGLPIVLNPLMAIPFILVPTLSGLITYFAIASGIVAPFTAISVPWTTPPVLSGLIVGGFTGALLQIFLIFMAAMIYLPFMKIADKQNVEQVQEQE